MDSSVHWDRRHRLSYLVSWPTSYCKYPKQFARAWRTTCLSSEKVNTNRIPFRHASQTFQTSYFSRHLSTRTRHLRWQRRQSRRHLRRYGKTGNTAERWWNTDLEKKPKSCIQVGIRIWKKVLTIPGKPGKPAAAAAFNNGDRKG